MVRKQLLQEDKLNVKQCLFNNRHCFFISGGENNGLFCCRIFWHNSNSIFDRDCNVINNYIEERGEKMILGLITSLAVKESISLLLEGSALAITTFYTAKTTKKTTSRRK